MRDLRQLQCFRSTALVGSVRGAAEHLGIAPSAISHQIRALERELELELFARHGRRLTLTPIGAELLADAERVFDALGELEDHAAELRVERSRRLVIGYFSSVGARWIADLVAYLEFSHRDVSVRLALTSGAIAENGQDLQIVVSGAGGLDVPDGMESELLLVDPFVAAVPRGSGLAERSETALAQLAAIPWIDNDDAAPSNARCRQIFIDACRTSGVDISFRHQAHDYRTALDMVDRGLGATILPRIGLAGVGENTAVLPISDPTPTRQIHLVWCRESPNEAVVADARRALRDLVAEDADVRSGVSRP